MVVNFKYFEFGNLPRRAKINQNREVTAKTQRRREHALQVKVKYNQ